jgi:hypothetical protein
MNRMLRLNPFDPRLPPTCGAAEGLFFSDIRLHIGLILREKNAHVFRPDLFDSHIVPTQAMLESLSASKGFIKVRYLSETPLKDRRHLRFIIYLVEAVAALARGSLIFDVVAERLIDPKDLRAMLKEGHDPGLFDLHVQTSWQTAEEGGSATTHGLRKIGHPELSSADSPGDHQVIVGALIERAAREAWEDGVLPESLKLEEFGDQFELIFAPFEGNRLLARIYRQQSAS